MRRVVVLLLAFVLLCTVACDKEEPVKEYYPIDWDMLTGLPADFPKLCDGVSSTEENSAQNAVSVYWNLISQEDFEGYLDKVADWAGVKLEKSLNEEINVTTYTLETDKYKVDAAYNPKATGDHIEAHIYDAQARLTVVTK